MKKKRGIQLTGILLVIVTSALWISVARRPHVVIHGNPSPADLAAVKSAVLKDMRKRVFPSFSWASFKSLFANITAYMRYDIIEIDIYGRGGAHVVVGSTAKSAGRQHPCDYYLNNQTGRWQIAIISPAFSPIFGIQKGDLPAVPVTNPPSPGSLKKFSPPPVTADKSLTELKLGPSREQPFWVEPLAEGYTVINNPAPLQPGSGASLTNLLPVGR